jgi:hypothetical protein
MLMDFAFNAQIQIAEHVKQKTQEFAIYVIHLGFYIMETALIIVVKGNI